MVDLEMFGTAEWSELFAPFRDGTLLVGFSGGADSTAALLVTQKFQRKFGFKLVAVHFNHHLRGAEAEAEAQQAQIFAQSRNIAFLRRDFSLDGDASGLEEQARLARLRAWQQLQTEFTSPVAVVTGHHADDRTENLWLMLCRGANSSGASTMRAQSQVQGVTFLRPLINFTRAEITEFLHREKISTWAEDSSNVNTNILRNYLRVKLLPELYSRLPGSAAGLRRAVRCLELDAQFIERCAREKMQNSDCHTRKFWQTADPALLPRLLRLWSKQHGAPDIPVASGAGARLVQELARSSAEPRRIPLGNNWDFELHGDQCRLLPQKATVPGEVVWSFRTGDVVWGRWHFSAYRVSEVERPGHAKVYFDGANLPAQLVIRAPQPGDHLVPWGQHEAIKVKKLRCNAHIPAVPAVPVVWAGTEIIWLPGIRRSNCAPVPSDCREIWCLEAFTPQEES